MARQVAADNSPHLVHQAYLHLKRLRQLAERELQARRLVHPAHTVQEAPAEAVVVEEAVVVAQLKRTSMQAAPTHIPYQVVQELRAVVARALLAKLV